MTLKDVAKKANVSLSTACKAINNNKDVSEETRQAVLDAANELNYFGVKKKTILENRKHSSPNFAIICPEITSPYYSRIVFEFCRIAEQKGCGTAIYNSSFSPQAVSEMAKNFNALPIFDAVFSLSAIDAGTKFEIPVIASSGGTSRYSVNDDGLQSAVNYLRQSGIEDIAYIGENLTASKNKSFHDICGGKTFISEKRFEDAGRDAAEFFLKNGMPKAVICGYDEIAIGFINTLEKSGIKVPRDIRVIGDNDIPLAKYFCGGLTSISYNYDEILPTVIDDIISDITANKIQSRSYKIKTQLILRNT